MSVTNLLPKSVFLAILELVQDGLIFKPTRTRRGHDILPMERPEDYGLQDFTETDIRVSDGAHLIIWHRAAAAGMPTFLVAHGYTGHLADRGPKLDKKGRVINGHDRDLHLVPLLSTLASAGAGVVAFSWRGYGRSRGKPTEKGMTKDALALLQFVEDQGVKMRDTIILAESLGGAVFLQALWQRESEGRPFDGIAGILCTFTSMADRAVDDYPRFTPDEIRPHLRHTLESQEAVRHLQHTELVLYHGLNDTLTAPRHSEKLAEEARLSGVKCTLRLVEGAGHCDIAPGLLMVEMLEYWRNRKAGEVNA